MKDPADSKTADLLPMPKRRGRPPSSGVTRTAAQRKRDQRERDRAAVLDLEGNVTVTALVEAIGRYAWQGRDDLVAVLARDLIKLIRERKGEKE